MSKIIKSWRPRVWLIAGSISLLGAGAVQKLEATHGSGDYVAHEWGTYTSVQGSDGKEMQGLHHGDEELPSFVHTPVVGSHCSYAGCFSDLRPEEGSPLAVTQRLETPVIYFYSKTPLNVTVDVDFPKGVMSEWYPDAQRFSPTQESFKEIAQGTISWDVEVQTGELEVPAVDPSSVWAPSRTVPANYLKIGEENERFIFYRGIGRYSPEFTVTDTGDGFMTIQNKSRDKIPGAVLLLVSDTRGAVTELGDIRAGETRRIPQPTPLSDQSLMLEDSVNLSAGMLKAHLIKSGLTSEESQAMVDTWRVSYFKTPGTRILYIAPRAWTDEILPIRFTPPPKELVRTLVGRVEVLNQVEEATLIETIKAVQQLEPGGHMGLIELSQRLGRFVEPKLRRAVQIARAQNHTDLERYIVEALGELR